MIHILSGPIHSGKTSRLLRWAAGQTGLAGIATPEQNGLKMLYDLQTGRYYPFQIEGSDLRPNAECTCIGRYRFSTAVFMTAGRILEQAARQSPRWLVIDEIGPLELQGRGFEPVAGRIISRYSKPEEKNNLILVIRDTILPQVSDHFLIKKYKIFVH